VEEVTAKAIRVKEKKAKNKRTSLKVEEAAAEVEDVVVSAEVEEEDASVDITDVVDVEEHVQSHKAKVLVTLTHREKTKVRAKGSPTRPVTLNVVPVVVAEEVVVAAEEEDSLVDSTAEVVTAVVVDEPQAAEVIKREEIATQRTRVVQMKVLHKKTKKSPSPISYLSLVS
jgi:hypothetical protein